MRKLVSVMLFLLCLLCVALPAAAEELRVGPFSFDLPDQVKVTWLDDTKVQLESTLYDYTMIISVLESANRNLQAMLPIIQSSPDKQVTFYDIALLAAFSQDEAFEIGRSLRFYGGMDENDEPATEAPVYAYAFGEYQGMDAQLYTRFYEEEGFLIFSTHASPMTTKNGQFYWTPQATIDIFKSVKLLDAAAAAQGNPADKKVAEAPVAPEKTVVVTGDSAKIRAEASVSGGLVKTATKGETFPYVDETGDWYVIDVNGRTGYIHKGVSAIK